MPIGRLMTKRITKKFVAFPCESFDTKRVQIHRRAWQIASVAVLILLLSANSSRAQIERSRDSDAGWVLSAHESGVTIYSRTRAGSPIKEFKAVGEIGAPTRAVQSVLDDVDAYTRFMPYVIECRVISRDAVSIVSYQRISPPFCTDRDYTIRVSHETLRAPGGPAFRTSWQLANALGPAERNGVIRVKTNEGSWYLEPSGENSTRATYRIYTDSGGSLPGFLANKANQIGIGKLFEAIRKQVKDPKYNPVR